MGWSVNVSYVSCRWSSYDETAIVSPHQLKNGAKAEQGCLHVFSVKQCRNE